MLIYPLVLIIGGLLGFSDFNKKVKNRIHTYINNTNFNKWR